MGGDSYLPCSTVVTHITTVQPALPVVANSCNFIFFFAHIDNPGWIIGNFIAIEILYLFEQGKCIGPSHSRTTRYSGGYTPGVARGHIHLLTPRKVERQLYSHTRDTLKCIPTYSDTPYTPLATWESGSVGLK